MTKIWERSLECAQQIENLFRKTGNLEKVDNNERLGLTDLVFSSRRYRRAHISIVDARETKNIWMLHVTVFPHFYDSSPIYGFDIVAGPNKVSGAFHDFSSSGDRNHSLMQWFADRVQNLEWNKRRELPDWAQRIFSKSMVAIGAVGAEELTEFCRLGVDTLAHYLDNLGCAHDDMNDYSMAQNRYCFYQKQNPHTPRVLVNLGFTEQEALNFVQNNLFPEVHIPALV